MQTSPLTTGAKRLLLLYAAALGITLALLALLLWTGDRLLNRGGLTSTSLPPGQGLDALLHLLLALAVVVATARIVGGAFTAMRQPAVIGEVAGGIMLGPSLLGLYFPEAYAVLASPPTIRRLARNRPLSEVNDL